MPFAEGHGEPAGVDDISLTRTSSAQVSRSPSSASKTRVPTDQRDVSTCGPRRWYHRAAVGEDGRAASSTTSSGSSGPRQAQEKEGRTRQTHLVLLRSADRTTCRPPRRGPYPATSTSRWWSAFGVRGGIKWSRRQRNCRGYAARPRRSVEIVQVATAARAQRGRRPSEIRDQLTSLQLRTHARRKVSRTPTGKRRSRGEHGVLMCRLRQRDDDRKVAKQESFTNRTAGDVDMRTQRKSSIGSVACSGTMTEFYRACSSYKLHRLHCAAVATAGWSVVSFTGASTRPPGYGAETRRVAV